MERISSIFKRPVDVSPEDLGAALFELTTENLQDLIAQAAKTPVTLGGIDRATFFAEAIALEMFAVQHAIGERVGKPEVRARIWDAFRGRYEIFRGVFHSRTLTLAEVDERCAAYAEVTRAHAIHLLPLGSQFVRHCGLPSPMGATTATAFYNQHALAVGRILDKARIVG